MCQLNIVRQLESISHGAVVVVVINVISHNTSRHAPNYLADIRYGLLVG